MVYEALCLDRFEHFAMLGDLSYSLIVLTPRAVAGSRISRHSFAMVERSQALESLTVDERIVLMGRLWDSLDPAAAAPLSPALATELDAREAEADADPDAGILLAALRDELRTRR